MNEQRFLLVVSGPSGSGKDTVVRELMKKHEGIELSISATTRLPRECEVQGVDYHFVTKEQFEQHIAKGELLEYASYVGNYYGTLKSEVDRRINEGITCVLIIEVEGAAQIKKLYPGCTMVFVMPPSMEELERRLRGRNTESEERILERMQRAKEEMESAQSYDCQVINEDVHKCAEEIYSILRERQK